MPDGDGEDDRGEQVGGGADAEDQPTIESLILSVTHYWSMRESCGRQVELLD